VTGAGGVPSIVGRDDELRAVSTFLGRLADGPRALVLEGTAGIGKTTLWQGGVAEARLLGHTVLVTRAAESEARMSYAALGDLLAGVPATAFAGLAEPLRRSLDRALLRGDESDEAPDPRGVSLAVAEAVRTLAADRPIVIAIDDVQWLDRPSARVLSFVFRRLTDEPVGVLESLRLGSGAPGDPIETDRAFVACDHLAVGPLTVGALGRVLRQRTNPALPRPFVVRLHEVANGNPLFALEVARTTLAGDARPGPGQRWPVPEDIQRLMSARLARLPPAAQRPLLAIAATSQPTLELVLDVAGSTERSLAGLARAEEAGVIERADGRIRFTHPLLASTVYANATDADRRDLHVRLASATTDPEERARHLALGTTGPNGDVAAVLEDAARHARMRGAPDAAAELVELARAMTPPTELEAVRRRRLAAAEYHFDSGDAARARQVLEETIAATPAGVARAEMLYRLASMSWMNLIDGVRAPAERALVDAGDDPTALCSSHNALAWVAFYLADLATAAAHARASAAVEPRAADPAVRSDALATLAFVEFLEGRPNPGRMTRGLELQDVSMEQASWTESSVYTTPGSIHGMELMWSGRLAEARALFERELAVYEQHAMFALRQEVLCYLAELECRAGRFELAASYGRESMDIIQENGQAATQSHVVLFNQAWPAALLGRLDEAREMATTGVRLADANDDRFNGAWNHAVLGFVCLSEGRYGDAIVHLEAAAAWVDALGSVELAIIPCLPDLAETLIALGRVGEAETVVARLEASAAGRDRPWAGGTAARGRALLAASAGDLERAIEAAGHSIAELERAGQPFEAARSRLVLGISHRRAKQKRSARAALERARDDFLELGARAWADRAEAEIGRIGGRVSAGGELTATEQRIAELVAAGRTNREVAAVLVVAERTVESALTQIYRKLDIRSRTELARRMGGPS
jgi:DNA-binding CsgD family transcriptional regulator/tetratricopeptide (TPR) repeat protein